MDVLDYSDTRSVEKGDSPIIQSLSEMTKPSLEASFVRGLSCHMSTCQRAVLCLSSKFRSKRVCVCVCVSLCVCVCVCAGELKII